MNNTIQVGDKAELRKAFTEEEVFQYSGISTDRNPLHLDKDFGRESIFGQRIVHGMLVASLFSGLIGSKLPGAGSIYLGQTLSFKAPVAIGEEVTASVEIINIRDETMPDQIKKITLSDGLQVGIKNLDSILSEVAQRQISDLQLLAQKLLKRVRACGTYVPSSAEDEYVAALLRQYLRKYGETEEIRDKNRDIVEPHKHTKG